MTALDEPVSCTVCGRPLKTAASRARGRGRVCDEKVNPPAVRHTFPAGPAPAARSPRAPLPSGPDLFDEQLVDEQAGAR